MPPVDPTADPNAGGILGLLGKLGSNPAALYQGDLNDPATQREIAGRGLLAMAGGFADAAMPSRMPIPFGAALGHAAAAMGTGEDAVMAARLQAAQAQQEQALASLTRQKANIIGGLLGYEQQWNQPDTGSAPPTVPGTITPGSGTVATVPVSTGRGPDGWGIPPNSPTATWAPNLSGTEAITNLAKTAAPIALPPGYTVELKSGYRPGAVVGDSNQPSQHASANAADFVIKRPDGSEVKNEGPDTEGVYGRLALTMRKIADPAIKPWLAWGGNFATKAGGDTADLMHFDLAGDRGHWGTLGAMERAYDAQNAPPPGGAPPVRMADASGQVPIPSGGMPPGPRPPAPPQGLLAGGGPAPGVAPPGPASTGTTVRGSWFGNSPGWPDPNDKGPQAGGLPASAGPGIALPIPRDSPDFGGWHYVTAPNGKTLLLQQTDVGPSAKGRGIDINSVAAQQFGYTPATFPTDENWTHRPAVATGAGPPPAQPPAGPPQPLVTPPGQAPAVPPITQPPAAVGPNIPGAPSPARIALAHKLALAYSAAGLAVPADVEAVLKFAMIAPTAAATAAATYPYDIGKATAGPTERGVQARITAGDEYINVPGYGWVQRKNLPNYTIAGGGGGGGAPPAVGAPSPAATPPGALPPARFVPPPGPGGPAPSALPAPTPPTGTPPGVLPSQTPAQGEIFKQQLADTTAQLAPYRLEKQAAPTQMANADAINDLMTRTRLGWGADSMNEAARILKALNVSDANIKQFTGTDPSAAGELNKFFLKFSSDAVRSLGAHEAASVLGQFNHAYPSLESDPNAAQLMTNALRMEAAWRFDRATAAEEWNGQQQRNAGPFGENYRGLEGFDKSFNNTNNPRDYWRAAVAMSDITPNKPSGVASDIAWKGASDADRQRIYNLIPEGRQFRYADGKLYVKPAAAGAQ